MAKKYDQHYDCTKLITSLDADGEVPCFFVVCSKLRGPGKTFQFSKLMIEHFLENGEKFILLTRNKGDLGSVAPGILDSYVSYAHPEWSVTETIQMKSVYSKVTLSMGEGEDVQKKDIGYVIPIRAADQIKKISSLFYDCWCFYFDEFQPMDRSTYLKDEVDLLLNIYKSIARGGGSAVRYMPIFMASNTINLGNPYFTALGLNRGIQSNTRFYKGHGVLFENCDVSGLAEMHSNSAVERALAPHLARKGDNMWIGDNDSLVAKPDGWGRALYVATLVYNNEKFGVRYYDQIGYTYISHTVDETCQYVYNLTLEGDLNVPLLKISKMVDTLKKRFFAGLIRVSDGGIQNMLMDVFG